MKLLIIIFCLLTSTSINARNYYFSAKGNDNNSGKNKTTPWRNIGHLNKVKLEAGDTVFFKSGEKFVGQINLRYSGKPNKPIVFASYGEGTRPVISGAIHLNNWQTSENGINNTTVNQKVKSLYQKNKRMPMARYPNSGFAFIDQGEKQKGFFDPALKKLELQLSGATVRMRTIDWVYETRKISEYNDGWITFGKDERYPIEDGYEYRIDSLGNNSMYTIKPGYGYYIEGKYELIDTIGEWFFDRNNNLLHYKSNSVSNIEAVVFDYGIKMAVGISNISIENLIFEKFSVAGIYSPGQASGVSVSNSILRNIDGSGVLLDINSNNITVENNHLHDITGRGISLRSTGNSLISGNTIRHIGMERGQGWSGVCSATGIVIMNKETEIQTPPFANHNIVSSNIVDSCGYIGIRVDGKHNRIEYNVVKNCMLTLNDGAGIYCFARQNDVTCYNTISHNIILNTKGDNRGTPGNGYISKGIYLDNNTHNITVQHNTVRGSTSGGIHINAGSFENTLANNVLYNNSSGITIAQWGNQGSIHGNKIINNSIYCQTKNQFAVDLTNWIKPNFDFGEFENNKYCNLNREFLLRTKSGHGNYHQTLELGLEGWQEKYNFDINGVYLSKKDKTRFSEAEIFINDTNDEKIIELQQTQYYNFQGIKIKDKIKLKPFNSIILLKGN